jgi:hypothetical protein
MTPSTLKKSADVYGVSFRPNIFFSGLMFLEPSSSELDFLVIIHQAILVANKCPFNNQLYLSSRHRMSFTHFIMIRACPSMYHIYSFKKVFSSFPTQQISFRITRPRTPAVLQWKTILHHIQDCFTSIISLTSPIHFQNIPPGSTPQLKVLPPERSDCY